MLKLDHAIDAQALHHRVDLIPARAVTDVRNRMGAYLRVRVSVETAHPAVAVVALEDLVRDAWYLATWDAAICAWRLAGGTPHANSAGALRAVPALVEARGLA